MSRHRVNIEDVRRIRDERAKINKLDFRDIDWYENGQKVEFEQSTLDDFEFTGLCNIDFIGLGIGIKKEKKK